MAALEHDPEGASEDEGEEVGSMTIFYIRAKVLDDLRVKLGDGQEVTKEAVDAIANGDNVDPEEAMFPLDLGAIDEDISDMDALQEKLGCKGVAELFVKAHDKFQEDCKGLPDDEVPKPMTAAEWQKISAEMDMQIVDSDGSEGEESEDVSDDDCEVVGGPEGEESEDVADDEDCMVVEPPNKRAKAS